MTQRISYDILVKKGGKSMSKKTIRLLIILTSVLLIFLVLSLVVQIIIIPKIKHEATELLIEQFIENDASASNILEQMDQQDLDTIEEIIDSSISSSDLSTISEYVVNRDIESIKKYAKSKLSESNKQKIMELYEKYKQLN